ncbi:uncharacterized protein LOC131884973 [Tigriopus californicus]|uniref:uncharacterized protein LOC131884973 n=1 Tax=Tigriopus californicus TaxID=6832 RepID=UPI0027DA58BD|nr:uncharacterized protein LOC131884973 [Tigriopus californicus]
MYSDRSLEQRTKLLWDHLLDTERKAKEMEQETERLRKIKDQAKEIVMERHPYLFLDELPRAESPEFLSDESQSYMTRDLKDIRDMLRPTKAKEPDSYMSQLQRLRDGLTTPGNVAAKPSQSKNELGPYLWPENCIPVPIETFKHLMAESSKAKRTRPPSSDSGPAEPPGDQDREVLKGANSPYGDDTSIDIADLSQENAVQGPPETPKEPEPPQSPRRVAQTPPPIVNHSTPPPKQASPIPPQQLKSDSESSKKNHSPNLSNEPDYNFAVQSDNSQEKLYSTESDTQSSPKVADQKVAQAQKNPVQPKPGPSLAIRLKSESTSSSSQGNEDSSSSSSSVPQPKAPPNPLSDYAKKFALKLNNDSASDEAPVKKSGGTLDENESISGAEDEDDEFWD